MSRLGESCFTLLLAVKGPATATAAQSVVDRIISKIGMTPIFKPAIFKYEGDIGLIYIQPIYESFVAYDAWPVHNGGYITVTSCREFSPVDVMDVVETAGFQIIDHSFNVMGLVA